MCGLSEDKNGEKAVGGGAENGKVRWGAKRQQRGSRVGTAEEVVKKKKGQNNGQELIFSISTICPKNSVHPINHSIKNLTKLILSN